MTVTEVEIEKGFGPARKIRIEVDDKGRVTVRGAQEVCVVVEAKIKITDDKTEPNLFYVTTKLELYDYVTVEVDRQSDRPWWRSHTKPKLSILTPINHWDPSIKVVCDCAGKRIEIDQAPVSGAVNFIPGKGEQGFLPIPL